MKTKIATLLVIFSSLTTTSCILFMLNDERHFDKVKDTEALYKAIDIPPPEGAEFTMGREIIKSTHGVVTKHYFLAKDWEDIKNHYRNILLPQGWEILEETKLALFFKKDGLTISIESMKKYPDDRDYFVVGGSKGLH